MMVSIREKNKILKPFPLIFLNANITSSSRVDYTLFLNFKKYEKQNIFTAYTYKPFKYA